MSLGATGSAQCTASRLTIECSQLDSSGIGKLRRTNEACYQKDEILKADR